MIDLLRETANDPFTIERGVDMGPGEDPFPAAELLRHLDLESLKLPGGPRTINKEWAQQVVELLQDLDPERLKQPGGPRTIDKEWAQILTKYEKGLAGPYPPVGPDDGRNRIYRFFKGLKNWCSKWKPKFYRLLNPEYESFGEAYDRHRRERGDVVRRVVGRDPGHEVSLAQLVQFVDGVESHRSFGGLFDGAIEELGWAMEVTGTQSVIDRVLSELPQGIREIISGLKSAVANLQPASDSVHAALSSGLNLLTLTIMNSKVTPPTVGQRDEAADRDVPILKYAHETIRLQRRLIAMRTSFADFATMVDNIGVTDAWRARLQHLQNGLKSTLS